MSLRRIREGAAVALAVTAGAGFTACGDDDEPTAGSTETTTEQTTAQPPSTSTTSTDEVPTEVSDEGHEGGGPDPGTEEAEAEEDLAPEIEDAEPQVQDPQSGGTDAGGGETRPSSGGASPPEAFEQFCAENPAACE